MYERLICMSDETNINLRPPMKPEQKDYTKMLQKNLDRIFSTDWMKTSLWNQVPKNKQQQKTPARTVCAETQKLHKDWQNVMKIESKVKQNRINIDPDISLEFFDKIDKIAKRLNCRADDLAALIYRESHFDPQIKSSSGKYAGLIQMDKTTFSCLDVKNKCSYEEYCRLPREKQLKYVEAYLKLRIEEKGLTGKKLSGGQIYTLIRRPKNINNPASIRANQRLIDKAKQIPEKMKQKMLDTKM